MDKALHQPFEGYGINAQDMAINYNILSSKHGDRRGRPVNFQNFSR